MNNILLEKQHLSIKVDITKKREFLWLIYQSWNSKVLNTNVSRAVTAKNAVSKAVVMKVTFL